MEGTFSLMWSGVAAATLLNTSLTGFSGRAAHPKTIFRIYFEVKVAAKEEEKRWLGRWLRQKDLRWVPSTAWKSTPAAPVCGPQVSVVERGIPAALGL